VRRAIIISVTLVVLAIVGAGLYYGDKYFSEKNKRVVRLEVVKDCKLHLRPCSGTISLHKDVEVVFEMTPKNPSSIEPILLRAEFTDAEPDRVQIQFEGKDMYMGFLQFELQQEESSSVKQNSTIFTGKGSLSVCIRNMIQWVAILRVELDDIIYELPFEFETVHLH